MTAKIRTISYAEIVNELLSHLPNREREVLQKRNALGEFPKHTLEQIGKDFNITRERVRQIEREGLKKILALDFDKAKMPVNDLEAVVFEYLQNHGGVMSEPQLKEELLNEPNEAEANALDFILANILSGKLSRIEDLDEHNVIWKLANVDLDEAIEIVTALKKIITTNAKPLLMSELIAKFKTHNLWSKVDENKADNEAILEALLRLREDIDKNILNHWGMADWNTIKPKRMTDKAYLIMLRENRPLHFAEVADLINQAVFDHKKACPATVHNELILDAKYVLVGRGIYALKEWGYQAGTVADIILNILKASGPLTKKDLTEKVLGQRLVQKTTITLALMNKDKFNCLEDGRYDYLK